MRAPGVAWRIERVWYNAHAPENMRAETLVAIEALQREGYEALGAEASVLTGDQQKMEVCMQS